MRVTSQPISSESVRAGLEQPSRLGAPEHLAQTIEYLRQLEESLPSSDPTWSELRMVRRVLGRLLQKTQEHDPDRRKQ